MIHNYLNALLENKMSDETVIGVSTALGQTVGAFLWPTKHLNMLKSLNKSHYGFSFQKVRKHKKSLLYRNF